MRGVTSILSLFRNEFNKFNNARSRMLGSIYHTMYDIKLRVLGKSNFWHKKVRFCHYVHLRQRYYVCHNVSRKSVNDFSCIKTLCA